MNGTYEPRSILRFLSENNAKPGERFLPLDMSSFSSDISSINGESSSKCNEIYGKEDSIINNNHQDDKKFVKTSLNLIQKYLNLHQSPFKMIQRSYVNFIPQVKSEEVKQSSLPLTNTTSNECLYPSTIREHLVKNKNFDDYSNIEALVDSLPPPKNHKKKLMKIKMISDAQQNRLNDWIRQRCLNSKNSNRMKYYYKFEKIKLEKFNELAQYVDAIRKGGPVSREIKFASQNDQESKEGLFTRVAFSESETTNFSNMYHQGEFMFMDKEIDQLSMKANIDMLQNSDLLLDTRHAMTLVNFSNMVTKCEKPETTTGCIRAVFEKMIENSDSPFNVKKNILYSNKLEDITDMIENQEEKTPVFDKTNHATEWLASEFLNLN